MTFFCGCDHSFLYIHFLYIKKYIPNTFYIITYKRLNNLTKTMLMKYSGVLECSCNNSINMITVQVNINFIAVINTSSWEAAVKNYIRFSSFCINFVNKMDA